MFKNDPDKSIDMLASGGAAVLANDGAATGCVEVTEAGTSDANTSKPLDEKSDNRGYGNVSVGVGDEDGAGVDTAPSALSNEEAAEAENLEPVVANADRRLVYRVVKRTFDVVFSAGVTVVLAIPVAIVCVAILIESPGAPMYSQERIGKGGKTIRVLKLRSMVADADNVERHLDPDQLKQWEMERKVDGDPRVTRVGKFIRKTSLDELPQFLNVLKGDMSVIGPRPITQDELEWFGENATEYLSVPMGITGLWQATSRNGASFESGERQRIELEYVRNAGFRMDTRCFFSTFGAMFGRRTGR